MKKKTVILLFICLLFCFLSPLKAGAQSNDAEKVINYIINTDESTVVDQILYHALQRIGYSMTMDAMPMTYAIQMANSGERDALAVQNKEFIAANLPNLALIPEQFGTTAFQSFVPKGSGLSPYSWEDLSGLVVGHLFQKTYIINHLPKDIAGSIQRETFYELNLALLAGECDVVITTSAFDSPLITVEGVVYVSTIDLAPTYTFVNKKFESIVPEFTRSLREMKADGTYDKIVNGEYHSPDHNPSVLHISSFYAEDLWDAQIRNGIMSSLKSGAANSSEVLYYNIPLYSNRFRSEYEQAKNAYYSIRTMMMSNHPDVIIASDINAILFVCNYYYTLFNDVPVILYGIDGEIAQLWQLGGNYTAIWETIPAAQNAEMIKKLFPNTTELYVINDYTATGAAWRADIERTLGENFAGMNVSYNKNLSYTDFLAEISSLGENTAILIGHCTTDVDGIYYSRSQIDSIILDNTNLPVFEMRHGCIGAGQIGGKYIDPFSRGIMLGNIAQNILFSNADTRFLPDPVTSEQSLWIFDEAVIRSRRIKKNLLPSEAELINHKPSLYEANPEAAVMMTIALILGIILFFSLIIFTMIMQRKDRRLYEREKTILAQEVSLANLDNILNGLEAMVCVTDPETDEIVFINNIMRKVFSVEENYIGEKCYSALRKLKKRCKFCPCIELDKDPDKMVVWEDHHRLTARIFRSFSRYIIWPNGKRVHLQYAVDITDIKRTQEEITEKKEQLEMALHNEENANRVKSSFLATMSHEIRTPMNVILGSTESLLENKSHSNETRRILEKIYNSGDLLLQIINDILDLSKIEANKFEIIPVKYETASLINDTVNLNIIKYGQKEINFTLNVDENLPMYLFGDELRLKQIINNLLSNAFKYTETGEITSSFIREDYAQEKIMFIIRVEDTGQGMTNEQLNELFSDYTRFNLEANRTTEGTGLGLVITRNLIRMMNGDINVESKPGKGSIFTVRIPQGIADDRLLNRETRDNLENFRFNSNLIKKKDKIIKEPMPYGKVLIVDDMKSNIDVAVLLLKPYQLQIETALSGYEAIDIIKSGKVYDIVFMDHMMPKMDGIETVRLIREWEEEQRKNELSSAKRMTIIALTANAIVGQAEMFAQNGFDGCITKPVDTRELNAMLNEHIRNKKHP